MKKYLLLLLFCANAFIGQAQYTEMPNFEKKKPWTTDIKFIGIGTDEKETEVTFAIGGGYSFTEQTYLVFVNPANGKIEKVCMRNWRRETGQYAMKFAQYGYDCFTLIFPPLPTGVNKIDLIAAKPQVYGISIRPVVHTKRPETKRLAQTESEIKELVTKSTLDITGWYESLENNNSYAVVQHEGSVYVLIGDNDNKTAQWKLGEVRGALRSTSVSNVYKATWLLNDKINEVSAVITFDSKSMTLTTKHPLTDEDITIIFIKMDANNNSNINDVSQKEARTGTGYAISDGHIVTNNHVVDGAKIISIKGVKGDMITGYTAEVVAADKTNDIAILRIQTQISKDLAQSHTQFSRGWPMLEKIYLY